MDFSDDDDDYAPHDEENNLAHNEEFDTVHTEENEVRRGVTVMKKVVLARNKGTRFEVAWNEIGQPIEPNGTMLISFIGAVVRMRVPITVDDWRAKILESVKNKIWHEIQRSFIVDEMHRKFIIGEAGKLHRGFRTYLTRKYLKDADGNINDDPPKNYKHMISKNEWKAFVAKRTDEAFESLSNMNRERASNPIYPYRKSRMGYARLQQNLLQETESEETSIARHILWRAARVNKDGVIDNENVQEVAEQCEKLSQSLPEEDFSDRDILAQVLNVPEYAGRRRGRGYAVSQRDNLPRQKRKNSIDERVLTVLSTLATKVDYLVRKDREKELDNITSDKDSCDIASQCLPEGISRCQLYLSSPTYRMVGKGSVHNLMGEKIHNTPIPAGHLKVTIDIAFEKNAPLPVPNEVAEVRIMRDAIGTFVAWPANLISIDGVIPKKDKEKGNEARRRNDSATSLKQIPTKNREKSKEVGCRNESVTSPKQISTKSTAKVGHHDESATSPKQIPKNFKGNCKEAGSSSKCIVAPKQSNGKSLLQKSSPVVGRANPSRYRNCLYVNVETCMRDTDMHKIKMEKSIFGVSYEEDIMKEEINELLHHKKLGATVICIYIRYLYEELVCSRQLNGRFSFLSPHITFECERDPKRVQDYIVDVLVKNSEDDKLFIAPYNAGEHWLLFVINATLEIVYYLDPLHVDFRVHLGMKNLIDTGLQISRAQRGSTVSKSKSSNITWIPIQCPRQPNNIDCGYYVMRFMKEILNACQSSIPKTYFQDFKCPNYSRDKLNEIKEEWCQYVLGLRII